MITLHAPYDLNVYLMLRNAALKGENLKELYNGDRNILYDKNSFDLNIYFI